MKIFKRIYYPVMAALVVLMLVLGIVDARVPAMGGKLTKAETDAATAYATSALSGSLQITDVLTDKDKVGEDYAAQRIYTDLTDDDGNNLAEYFRAPEVNGERYKLPGVFVQKTKVRHDAQGNGSTVAVEQEVENVILALPGKSEQAILLHARTDGSVIGGGADAASVGALTEIAVKTLKEYNFRAGEQPENTIVFLFGDAGQYGDLGAAAFMHQFKGFDNVAGNIKAVADFQSGGTGGTLMTYAESDGNLGLVGKYARFNGGTFASSALAALFDKTEYASAGVFGDVNTLRFTNRGGFNRYGTAGDGEVSAKLVGQQANAMARFISCFANDSIAALDAKSNAVYFSYLDVMTVYYPAVVAFVIAGIILGLMIAVIILNVRNKTFSWGKALAGLAVQLVTLLATALSMLVLYYLFALLLSGFGVIPFHSLSAVKFAGTGMLISAMILAVTIAICFYILLKRAFGIKAIDVVRGNTVLFAIVAVVLSFALPAVSYPFTCVALFSLVAMLMTVLFKNKFKKRFSTDIERLFLYVWGVVFALPLFMPLFYAAQTAYAAVSVVVIGTLFVALSGCIAPFADYLKPVLDKAFGKLPQRTVRVERTVVERQEDRAKKGKFTEVTVKKVEKEKIAWKYMNRIGLSLAAFISAVMIVLFCSFGTAYSSAAVATYDYYDSVYDDSLLFVYDDGTATVEVHDQVAYNYIRYAVNDLNWDADKKAYVKNYNGSVDKILGSVRPELSVTENTVSFSTVDASASQIVVTLKNAKKVTSVIFNKDTDRESEEYEFSEQEEIVFRLPFGYEEFSMTVEGSCDVELEQQIRGDAATINNLLGLDDVDGDWDKLAEYYVGNDEIYPALRSGIVIRLTKSVG